MYDDILIPTDGSKGARKAADHGARLAAAFDATVHAMYVVDLPNTPRAPQIMSDEEQTREEYRNYGEEVTGDVEAMVADAGDGTDCVTVLRSGTIHEEIVDYADEEDIDVIVMGTGYRGKFRALLGSTAEKVVRTATVPVTTLRRRDVD